MTCYLNELGIVNALGGSHQEITRHLNSGARPGFVKTDWVQDFPTYIAQCYSELPEIPARLKQRYDCRNNQLALAAVKQLEGYVQNLLKPYDPSRAISANRVAIVIGTSTSGIAAGEEALIYNKAHGRPPANYRYQQQEIGTVSDFIADYLNVSGPAYTISTACSSSGHAFNSAIALLESGQADVVIAGGVDSLCKLTVNGFASLESVSQALVNPFSAHRDGINIGEAAALFVVTRTPSPRAVELLSVGSSSDAHHISAPEPDGVGAERAIRDALQRANLTPDAISYINLHGTGTPLNDAMESKVIARVFGHSTLCSSSKGQLGHSLGAAAANELALCWLSLQSDDDRPQKTVPPHLWDGEIDSSIDAINLAGCDSQYPNIERQTILSNSFAFGGNNTAVIIREC